MNKSLAALILFLGELITITGEIYAAKYFNADQTMFKAVALRFGPLIVMGSLLLMAGYMFSMATFKNIWIVSVISVVSILIAEPILNYTITHQLPTRGAAIGFALGILGLFATLFL
jgi:hypothetical protein